MQSHQRTGGEPKLNRRGFLTAAAGSAVATAFIKASAVAFVKAWSITSQAEESSSMSHHFDSPTGREDGRLNLCDLLASSASG